MKDEREEIEEIDELIEKALTKEEAEFYHKLDEQSLPEMVGGLFQGKLKWISMLMMVVSFIFLGLAIYCLVHFLETDNVAELIRWGAGMFACLMAQSMIKLFHWMQMDKNALKREIKRLELQISILAKKL